MIPQRIRVQGFLCYRAEQEICFDTAALWVLAGVNGSGKSAVFDGVTYALFGGHRAGKEHADELINKASDRAVIEFEFLLDEQRYCARRTLKRKKQGGATPTQQLLHWQSGSWEEVPDTGNKRGFDRWIADNVGLTYETFTSSVLLMQGKAEKLLAAQPKDRFEVLAGIVDLARFQRLHERADEQRRRLKEQVEVLQRQLDALPEVSDSELRKADEGIDSALAAVERGKAELERLQRLVVQAEHWRGLQGKVADAQKQCQAAEALLTEANAIERDWARLRELRDGLPHLKIVVEQRDRLTASKERTAVLIERQRTLAARRGELTFAAEQARQKLHQLQQAIATGQEREQAVGGRLRELSALLGTVRLCEQQRTELARLDKELACLPADPAAEVGRGQDEFDRLTALVQALPHLGRFRAERDSLRSTEERRTIASAAAKTHEAKAAQLAEEEVAVSAKLAAAVQSRSQAEERATAARTLLEQAQKQLQQLTQLSGATACSLCGQPLTAEHMAEESQRRKAAHTAALVQHEQAQRDRQAAQRREKELKEAQAKTVVALSHAREEARESARQVEDAERDALRHAAECKHLYAELPEPLRRRIHDGLPDSWPDTTFPTDPDLVALQEQAAKRPAVQKRLQAAQAVAQQWDRLQAQRDTVRQTLAVQEANLPADVSVLRQEHEKLDAEDQALKADLQAQRARWQEEQVAFERLQREQTTVREQLADQEQEASKEEVRRDECEKTLQRARGALPNGWSAAADSASSLELQGWQTECAGLEARGIPARAKELETARAGLEALRQRRAELEAESERIPAEARCEPTELEGRLATLRKEQTGHDAALLEAQKQRDRLAERQARRQQLQHEHAALDRRHTLQRHLAELLGRNRLQLHLVRQAERGIVDFANAVLDRLSGGQLYLRLRGDEAGESGAEQALHLEAYNRSAGSVPIGVPFLSGSQRFRVAVSLALGIGQYASRQHRPIESVIIDEGFGCLDRDGRQVMIQELQNLRGQLRCILLVSHQEEFADAFADGYHFELTDGTTQVTRIQR